MEILAELYYLVFRIGHEVIINSTTMTDDDQLPQDANEIANFLVTIFDECRHLNASPESFPSQGIREAFLTKVESLCETLESIDEMIEQQNNVQWTFRCVDLAGVIVPKDDPAKLRSLVRNKIWPLFHPHRPFAKNPWSNWLDRLRKTVRSEWVSIQRQGHLSQVIE